MSGLREAEDWEIQEESDEITECPSCHEEWDDADIDFQICSYCGYHCSWEK